MARKATLLPFCLLPFFLLAAACRPATSFDERYEEQSEAIRAAANSVETEVAGQLANAREAEQAGTDTNGLPSHDNSAPAR